MNLHAKYSNGPTNYIRLWKVGAVGHPDHKSDDPNTYPVGTFDTTGESVPVGYFIEGWLVREPAVGERVEVLRISRDGVLSLGHFTSSKVVELEAGGFRTRNSLYSLAIIPLAR